MRKLDEEIVREAKDYVCDLFNNKLSDKFLYHNKNHTLEIINNIEFIGEQNNLSNDNFNILRIAALFHDVGYVDNYKSHEESSVSYATKFLEERQVDSNYIKQVAEVICSTQFPQTPENKISEIMCDADLMYLASESDYFEKAELLRQEWNKVGRVKLNSQEFLVNSLEFFDTHHFHTEYGKSILQSKKEKNKKLISEKVSANRSDSLPK